MVWVGGLSPHFCHEHDIFALPKETPCNILNVIAHEIILYFLFPPCPEPTVSD